MSNERGDAARPPTFILKTREGETSKKENADNAESSSCLRVATMPAFCPPPPPPRMTAALKFVDETMQLCGDSALLEYLSDRRDFLVVGCLGLRGVGKSTVMSLLTSDYASDRPVFPVADNGTGSTTGVDAFVTDNRVIYLDAQPVLSVAAGSTIDSSSSSSSSCYDQKKTAAADFTANAAAETNLELRSLQLAAFFFSVCHVVLFVQDWFVDPNVLRFLRTAEMLKPSSATNMDPDYVEYYPRVVFLHNKAELQDFAPGTVDRMKQFYAKVFSTSRLQTRSGLDANDPSAEPGFNLFLLPRIGNDEDSTTVRRNEKKLVQKLKTKIHGVDGTPMTPTPLTEKNWYHYVSRVMDAIKKSHLSSEYGRLMP